MKIKKEMVYSYVSPEYVEYLRLKNPNISRSVRECIERSMRFEGLAYPLSRYGAAIGLYDPFESGMYLLRNELSRLGLTKQEN